MKAPQWIPEQVFGQPDGTLALPNAGTTVSAHGLHGPRGVASTPTSVYVADTENSRVVAFDRSSNAPDAVLVLGQNDFATSSANTGGASLTSMRRPEGLCTDGTQLAVADTSNHRVLVWITLPLANGQPADIVLGQADGASVDSNRGSASADADTLATPSGCLFARGSLLVADTGNNRVLVWNEASLMTGASADAVLGQPDFTTRTPAALATDTNHLAGPAVLSADAANMYVGDRDLGRVVAFAPDGSSAVLGGVGTASLLRAGAGIAADPASFFTTTLLVSETGNNDVAIVAPVSRLIVH